MRSVSPIREGFNMDEIGEIILKLSDLILRFAR
jgi:hypothetical protein